MKLNQVSSPLTREERNEMNKNWITIEHEFNKVVETVSEKAYGDVIDAAKLDWKEPVDTHSDLETVYPEPLESYTVMTRDNGKVHRYNGTEWKEIQQIDATPINEVDRRLKQKIDDGLNSVNQELAQKAEKNKVPEKQIVDTTTSRWWSESIEHVVTTINNEYTATKTVPTSYKEKVLFIGSSSTEGTGASTRDNAWFKIIESRLGDEYDCYFRGIGGDDTNDVMNRFYIDVAPVQPDFVILQLTIGNEGIYSATDKVAVYQQFRKNMLQIIRMIQQLGATPIVASQGPTERYDSEIYNYGVQLNTELQMMGIHMFDWMGNLVAENGRPISALMHDTLHYNDNGQLAIANSFPPSLLKRAKLKEGGYLSKSDGFIKTGIATTEIPIYFMPEHSIPNYTVFFRVNYDLPTGAAGIVSFNDDFRVFVNQYDGRIYFHNGIDSPFRVDHEIVAHGKWISFAITYHSVTKEIILYADGVEIMRWEDQNVLLTRLTLAGRVGSGDLTLNNAKFKDLLLYRTRLNANQVRTLHEGTYHQSSLELFSPLNDKIVAPGTQLVNLAPTTSNLMVDPNETSLTSS